MIRVILCPVAEVPRVTSISPDDTGDYSAALESLLGLPAARVPLHDGIQLCCSHGGLLFGLALARRALTAPLADMRRLDTAPRPDVWEPVLGLDDWPISGDFLLARSAADGELVDLTDSDVRFYMFWLGFDYILNH